MYNGLDPQRPADEKMMEGLMVEAFLVHHAEFAVLCEVSGSTAFGGVGINKQVEVRKRGAKASAQLGYACIQDDLNETVLQNFPIDKFVDVFGFSTPRKGGNEFSRQSKRFFVKVGDRRIRSIERGN